MHENLSCLDIWITIGTFTDWKTSSLIETICAYLLVCLFYVFKIKAVINIIACIVYCKYLVVVVCFTSCNRLTAEICLCYAQQPDDDCLGECQ